MPSAQRCAAVTCVVVDTCAGHRHRRGKSGREQAPPVVQPTAQRERVEQGRAGGELPQPGGGLRRRNSFRRLAEQVDQLVEEWNVVHRPVPRMLVRGCQGAGRLDVEHGYPGPVGEPGQHLGRGKPGPPAGQEPLELGAVADLLDEQLAVQAVTVHFGPKRVQQDRRRDRSGGIGPGGQRFGPGAHPATRLRQLSRGQRQHLAREHQSQPLGRGRRRLPHQVAQQLQHPVAALDLGHRGGVPTGGAHPADELADRPQVHAVLTQGGQHPADVRGEHGRRADHQDATVGEPAPVGEEQVGGAVQGDLRLAGAGAAGDERDAAGRGADRLVLFLLNGGDDVAHLRAPSPSQRRQQRAFTEHRQLAGLVRVQHIVVEVHHLRPTADDHPPAYHPHRLAGRGPVERGRGRGPPVDQQRLPILVAYAQPADVVGLAVVEVQPPEHQPLRLGVQRPQLRGGLVDDGVPLDQPAARAGDGAAVPLPGQLLRLRAQVLDAGVDPVHEGLLTGDFLGSRVGHDDLLRRGVWAAWRAYARLRPEKSA